THDLTDGYRHSDAALGRAQRSHAFARTLLHSVAELRQDVEMLRHIMPRIASNLLCFDFEINQTSHQHLLLD
ncbi:unnamed protein product, partial [Citrullus colocynthis]